MKKDLPENVVKDIGIAIVLEEDFADSKSWKVYLLNFKKEAIDTVLISSKGYGTYKGEQVRTSILRHSIGTVDANDYALIEGIDERLFAINNEYWLSYYQDGTIYDKKFIFLTESVTESNFIRIPILNKPGVMIS